ncbi:MAG: SLATT domain-containing protein [Pseudomonadota bacterium]
MSDDLETLRNRIWLTSKARKFAEHKCHQRNVSLHFVVFISTVTVIGFSVFQDDFCSPAAASKAITSVSVLLLAISIFLFGQRFGERAVMHRECYLRLDRLRDQSESAEELAREYANVLHAYPNHTSADFDSFVYSEIVLNRRSVTDPSGEEYKATFKRGLSYFGITLSTWVWPLAALAGAYLIWTFMQC